MGLSCHKYKQHIFPKMDTNVFPHAKYEKLHLQNHTKQINSCLRSGDRGFRCSRGEENSFIVSQMWQETHEIQSFCILWLILSPPSLPSQSVFSLPLVQYQNPVFPILTQLPCICYILISFSYWHIFGVSGHFFGGKGEWGGSRDYSSR